MLLLIASFSLLLGQVKAAPDLCVANSVEPARALAADVLPLSNRAACKIVDFDAASKLSPASVRWVNARISVPALDQSLASEHIWLTEGQARAWLASAKTNPVVVVGSGVDDKMLAARCGQMFETERAVVLRGGVGTLNMDVPLLSANEALVAILNAEPKTLTLLSSEPLPTELSRRLRDKAVRFEKMPNNLPVTLNESTAALRLSQTHSKRTLNFNITGGIPALLAAYHQSTALALAPKSEPRRPCYFP